MGYAALNFVAISQREQWHRHSHYILPKWIWQ